MKRIAAAILAVCLTISLAACGAERAGPTPGAAVKSGGDLLGSAGSYVYGAEELKPPLDDGTIGSYLVQSERIYFSYTFWGENGGDWTSGLYSMASDGGGLEKYSELRYANYALQCFDDSGAIWCISGERVQTEDSYTTETFILRLDEDCAETGRWTPEELGVNWPIGILFDAEGRMCVCGGDGLLSFFAMAEAPTPLFSVEIGYCAPLRTADGRIALFETTETGTVISVVDADTQSLVTAMEFPRWYEAISGADSDIYLNDGANLYGFDLETKEQTKLLNWTGCGIDPLGAACMALGDGRFLMTDAQNRAFLLLSERYIDHEPVTVTLATAGGEYSYYIKKAAADFNRSHDGVKVELLDYSIYNTDLTGGVEQSILLLTTEIIAGNVPDMFDLSGLPALVYANKGMLENLYPFIDADGGMEREDFFQSVFTSMEIGGALYELTPCYRVETAAANAAFLGGRGELSFDDVDEIMAEHPGLQYPYGLSISRSEFLEKALAFNMSALVDWETGSCAFDGELFLKILETAGTLPEERVTGESTSTGFEWDYDETAMLASGRQLLCCRYPLAGFSYMRLYTDRLGDDFSFVGFPCAGGNGSAVKPLIDLGMSSASEHKDECWQFLRTLLLQPPIAGDAMPIRRDAAARDGEAYLAWLEGARAEGYQLPGDMPAAIEKATALIERVDKAYRTDEALMGILSEETAAYFAGDKTAEEAAARIQSRAGIYIAEQAG